MGGAFWAVTRDSSPPNRAASVRWQEGAFSGCRVGISCGASWGTAAGTHPLSAPACGPDGLRWVGARVAVRAAFQGPVSEPASDRTGGLGGPCGEEPLVPRPVSPEAGGAAEPDLSRPLRPPAAACPGPRPTGQARRLPTRLAFSVAATLASPCSHSLFWFAYSFKKLRSSRNVKVTLLKCMAQWHLVHPQRQFQASSLPPEGTLPGQPLVCLLGLHGSAHRSGARACLTAPTNVSWVRDGQCPKTAGQS